MTNLATQADLEARIGRSLTTTEATRAAAYLTDASALIRGYTRQTFTAVDGDVVELRPVGMRIRLPERPVTAVNSVEAIGWGGLADITLPVGSWGWDGIDVVEITPFDSRVWINFPELDLPDSYPDTYRVDYDHGDADVPDDVVAVAASMVLRTLLSPSLVEGMTSEHIGQYSYQLGQFAGGAASGTSVRLTEADKDALRNYRRQATSIQVRL